MKTFTFRFKDYIYANNKKIYLNLNTYRNLHYSYNSKAKNNFKYEILEQLKECPKFKKVEIEFKIFKKYRNKKKLVDKSNVYSVAVKYLYDAITEEKIWKDDNDDIIKKETILETEYKKEKTGDLDTYIEVTLKEIK